LLVLFNTVLAPSPEVLARVQAEQRASTATEEGNYQQALMSLDKGLAVVPNDANLLTFKGVVQQLLQQNAEAEQTFALAQKNSDNPLDFYLGRVQLYLRFNQLDPASRDVESALKLNDKVARCWLLQGQVFEMQGKTLAASEAYNQAGKLALDQNENEIYVMARVALVRLSQMPPAFPSVTPESGTPESQ
jgi:tetratricopeptide (TPR) repeat protein